MDTSVGSGDFLFNQHHSLTFQLFACSVDSPQVHQAWVNAPATELDEADGLGRMPPFPLLGDKGGRRARGGTLTIYRVFE